MTGKLKIELKYEPSVVNRAELWGRISLTYSDNNQEQILYYTNAVLNLFVQWYFSASLYIFAPPPLPFIEGKSYSEGTFLYREEFSNSLSAMNDLESRKAFKESNKIYARYFSEGEFNIFANGFEDVAEPMISIVRRGDHGEISFAEKDTAHYIKNTEYTKRWIKPGPWAYFFDLESFVSETKDTIFVFLHDVQERYANDASKKRADELAIMALILNQYPKLD